MRWILPLAISCTLAAQTPRSPEYAAVQNRLARGWNTWDVHSVAAQVLLPEGFTIRVGLKHNDTLNSDAFLADPLIGRQGQAAEQVFPGPHTWNGSYTELRLTWRGHELLLQSAHDGDDLVMLATPLASKSAIPPTLVLSTGLLWNRPGSVARSSDHLEFTSPSRRVSIYCTEAQPPAAASIPLATPYFAAAFENPIGLSTGHARTVDQIRTLIDQHRPTARPP